MNSPVKLEIKAEVDKNAVHRLLNGAEILLKPFGIGLSILSYNLALYRLENAVEIAKKAHDILKENGIHPCKVDPKFMCRFIDLATLENDKKIQEMWANLLVNESQTEDTNYVFLEILSQLNSSGANLLNEIYQNALKSGYDPFSDYLDQTCQDLDGGSLAKSVMAYNNDPNMFLISAASKMTQGEKLPQSQANIKIMNVLEKNSLIRVTTYKSYLPTQNNEEYQFSTYASITPFGYEFVEACSGVEIE